MPVNTQTDQAGRFFTLLIPKGDVTHAPYYVAGCTVLEQPLGMAGVRVVVGDWLDTTVCFLAPYRHQTIEHVVYLAICAFIDKERIDFLCSMMV